MNPFDSAMVFLSVVEHGSMSAAAEFLGQSPSAVSKQITYLEKTLSTQLLKRTTRRIEETESGILFYESMKRVQAQWQQSVAEASSVQSSIAGKLRIAAPHPVCSRLLVSIVGSFQHTYPDVEVELEVEHYNNLPRKGADISICRQISPFDSSHYVGKRLATYTNQLFASPEYLIGAGTPKHVHDLGSHACLHFGFKSPAVWNFSNNRRVSVSAPLRTNSTGVAVRWALEGHGIVRIPPFMVATEHSHGQLVRVLPDDSCPKEVAFAYYSKVAFRSRKVDLFLRHARQSMQDVLN